MRATANPAQTIMPTTIPAMAPVPRLEPLVDNWLETGKEEGVADEEPSMGEGLVIGREEEVADEINTDVISLNVVLVACGWLDVTRDTEEVGGTADSEGVGSASTPWLHVTALDCGELSTLKIGLRILWELPSEAL